MKKMPSSNVKIDNSSKVYGSSTIRANAMLLPGMDIGEGAIVAVGFLVTKDFQPLKLAIGVTAEIKDLPEDLKDLPEDLKDLNNI